MKRRTFLTGLALVGIILAGADDLAAHGLGYRILESGNAVTLEFSYTSGDPLSYAAVLIYAPEDDSVEFQNGRTDREGRFAFLPARVGEWRFVVDDGTGHRVSGKMLVGQQQASITQDNILSPPPTKSKTLLAVFGLSVILNITLSLRLLKK